MSRLCRSCLATFADEPDPTESGLPGLDELGTAGGATGDATGRCPSCASPRMIAHPELSALNIAHIDCDAFYAEIEKSDRPELRDRPVIVGGGRRGVVTTACYLARLYGVHSAMPMFKALKACPEAVVIRPNMAKYREVGRRIREIMSAVTPLVEPISIDEAFLDLSGTRALHGGPPARTLAKLVIRIEDELRLTASIGLSYNKFLAKIASDLDKPRGFAVIGRAEAPEFLKAKPVGIIWGVGKALRKTLARDGVIRVGDLLGLEEAVLVARYGAIGRRLFRFSRGRDERAVTPDAPPKSLSAETTFETDLDDPRILVARLWPLCETLAGRLKHANLAAHRVTLKLKTSDFRQLTRTRRLDDPTCLGEVLYRTAEPLLGREADGRRFRLIGIGASDLRDGALADPPDLLDPGRERRAQVERAIDAVRAKLGVEAIAKGRSMAPEPPEKGRR